MSLHEVTERVHALGNAWEQFKQVNDARLNEIERKGYEDPLYLEHLAKISSALDQHKQRMDGIETAVQRPLTDMGLESKSYETALSGNYRSAFCNYLRKGMETELEMHTKALSVGTDADGGHLVTPRMSDVIVKTIVETSALRKIASIETISTEGLEIIDDRDVMGAGWTTETGSPSDTTTSQFGKRSIPVFELYAQPKATQKLVDDVAIDIEAWLSDKLSEAFSKLENTAFLSGDGTTQPKGFLTYAAGTSWGQIEQINSGTNGAVTADGLIKVFYALKEAHATNATFLMNRTVLQAVRLLKEATTNQYLWQPGLAAGAPDTLLGVPVMQAADMPIAATNSLSVAVGDFKAGYKIVDRTGIRILRDPFTNKPFVKFYTTKRVGGDVVNFDAIKLLKLAA